MSQLNIAVGKSRKETSWKKKEMSWPVLIDRLSKTHRTSETHADYIASKKERQDEIKDVGGFVGGYLQGGRRKKGAVLSRSLLTLDIDHCPPDFDPWEVFSLLYDCAACVYSTHKHTPKAKRLRLVIPFSRDVNCDEYVAVCRRVAGDVGIEVFDDTTFQPHRLMYWPSTSQDGEFYFNSQEGPELDVDAVLASYSDWKDASQWPVSSRVNKIIEREATRQGDPLEKPGLIGAFCQTYDIHQVIERYLADRYERTDSDPNRYSFTGGSTSGGMIVYEDKFSYSHHETDPAGGKLCNAFDLYRLHKFGLKDENTREGTQSNRLPSYLAAVEAAAKDPTVKGLLGKQRLEAAREEFGPLPEQEESQEVEEVSDDWLETLEVDGKGNYLSTVRNVSQIIGNDPALKGCFARDTFEKVDRVVRSTPWRKVAKGGEIMTDDDDAGLREYIEAVYKIASPPKIKDAIRLNAMRNSIHPVRDYLEGLKWDGVDRLDTLLIDFQSAEDCAYTRAVTRKTLVAAVARIYKPGCKFDYVLTLVGEEGIKKSSLLHRLGRDWFSDSFYTMSGKEAYEQLQGSWIIEMGEMAGMKKADVENAKLFISKRHDRYRAAYGHRVEDHPRQCIFVATTNDWGFLQSRTGNRRFWPVEVAGSKRCVFNDLRDDEVDQIWAEAKHRYRNGEPLWLESLESEARKRQEVHTEKDEREGAILHYLDMLLPENWESMNVHERRSWLNEDESMRAKGVRMRDTVTVAEIWTELFGKPVSEMTRYNTRDINVILRNLEGWSGKTRSVRHVRYGIQRAYIRNLL